jgi:hypothetical protein
MDNRHIDTGNDYSDWKHLDIRHVKYASGVLIMFSLYLGGAAWMDTQKRTLAGRGRVECRGKDAQFLL